VAATAALLAINWKVLVGKGRAIEH
jgi:hypothetical protein